MNKYYSLITINRIFLFCTIRINFFSPVDLHERYGVLVEQLKAERKYEHAAIILKEYLNDIEEAVALLCEGRIWKHAIRISIDVQRSDLNG